MLSKPVIIKLWQQEFSKYSGSRFRSDLIAGLTVAAVALPLALAFGVAGGASPAAGMVTAILGGFIIGALSGAPYQISGPTGAMSAVLIVIVQKHGLQGLWLAGIMAGIIILALGLFHLGRIVNFIPAPVITGFTSGIALIIFVGQIDNFLGVKTPAADSTTMKAAGYFTRAIPGINWQAVCSAAIVMVVMLALPRFKPLRQLPAALVGIILATLVSTLLNWQVAVIGAIPSTILLDQRYQFSFDNLGLFSDLLGPAMAIAALGAIESLLAGLVAGRMTGLKLNANQELVAQGIGNIIIPFFGGVPATAAIARISVAVKAGGRTRMVSFIHSFALLICALFLGEQIGHIPLATLAGVLMVTAWRMNEWHVINFYFKRRFKSAIAVLLATLVATVTFDLTQAIIIGIVLSLLLFINQVSRLDIVPTDVDWERLRATGLKVANEREGLKVVYVSGSLFFGAAGQFVDTIEALSKSSALILSMRGVPVIDASGLHAIEHIWQHQLKQGGLLFVTGLQAPVYKMFQRAGLVDELGADKFYWSADQAITQACASLSEGEACEWRPGRKVEEDDEAEALLNSISLT